MSAPHADPRALLATPDALRTWLEDQRDHDVVGISMDASLCTVSEFLMERGYWYPEVSQEAISWADDDSQDDRHEMESPEWLRIFLDHHDSLTEAGGWVLACQALRVLDRALEDR